MKKSLKGNAVMRKVLAVFACFFGIIFLVGETYAVLANLIPYVSISLFKNTGISIAEGLTFSEFSVGDIVVLLMMWGMPSLCAVALMTAVQWKLIAFIVKWLGRLLKSAFFTKSMDPAE